MRFVSKQRLIPESFAAIVNPIIETPGSNGYNSLGYKKSILLELLITEQNGLCAYCNQKITIQTATVEHLVCQSHNDNFDLNYHNLFAVCKGNEGIANKSHCDKYRANVKDNDYFFPFILLKQCITHSWDQTNPFFDIKFNRRIGVVSGEIIPKEASVKGYPTIKSRIQYAIDVLNLNAPILISARKEKWENVLNTKAELNYSWKELFNYYLDNNQSTDFVEFVLLAIRKQETI